MDPEHILEGLAEIEWRSECLLGSIEEILTEFGMPYAVRLSGESEAGLTRIVFFDPEDSDMFPDFIVGRRVGILANRKAHTASYSRYAFRHLAFVANLAHHEERALYPWRHAAEGYLATGRLTRFETGLCTSLRLWGRPPTPKQRESFRRIRTRLGPPPGYVRQRRPPLDRPVALSDALVEALIELRRVWVQIHGL